MWSVNIRRCADLIVSQSVRDCYCVHAVVNQHTCHRVPETVRIQMGQVVTFGKLRKPRSHRTRMDRTAVFLREDKSLIFIIIAQPQTFRRLSCFVVPKFRHRFRRKADETGGIFCFRGIDVYTAFLGVQDVPADVNPVILKTDVPPLQTQCFPSPTAGHKEQKHQRPPLSRLLIQRGQDRRHIFGLIIRRCTLFCFTVPTAKSVADSHRQVIAHAERTTKNNGSPSFPGLPLFFQFQSLRRSAVFLCFLRIHSALSKAGLSEFSAASAVA